MKTTCQIRWDTEKILAEARKRTAALTSDNSKRVQEMLQELMEEAGWTEEDFIDALCTDVIARKSIKCGPGLAKVGSNTMGGGKKRTG